MRTFMIQPSAYVDHITEDGAELTRSPYPLYTDDEGNVLKQEFWRGDPQRIPGFMRDAAVQQIDVPWSAFVEDPQQAVGMYIICQDDKGNYSNQMTAVERVETLE